MVDGKLSGGGRGEGVVVERVENVDDVDGWGRDRVARVVGDDGEFIVPEAVVLVVGWSSVGSFWAVLVVVVVVVVVVESVIDGNI